MVRIFSLLTCGAGKEIQHSGLCAGVAPRAKMNQQRQRRFRTAMEAKEALNARIAAGEKIPDAPMFDSNCITPGTEFMQKLSNHLRFFVRKKLNEDAGASRHSPRLPSKTHFNAHILVLPQAGRLAKSSFLAPRFLAKVGVAAFFFVRSVRSYALFSAPC